MNFGMIMKNQSMVKMQNFVIWIETCFIVQAKAEDIAEDVETRSNFNF